MPATQLSPARQALKQPPQLAGSVAVRAQVVPQVSWPGAVHSQVPRTQICAASHRIPQPPQFASSCWVSAQAAPQVVSPGPQLGASGTPPSHAAP
jgi:hypothetical protein